MLLLPASTSDAKQISLSQGYVAIIDSADFDAVMQHKWSVTLIKGRPYATRGEVLASGKQRIQYLHRFLLAPDPGQQVDHSDHDTLNCRRSNIRIATRSQNGANRRRPSTNTSGYIGVQAARTGGRFNAIIGYLGKKLHVGTYPTAIDAAKARDKKAIELFGPFAFTNFSASELAVAA